jgi:hypothetical protein
MSKQGLTTQFTPTRIKKITHIHLHAYQHLRAHTTSIRHTPTRLTFWSAMAMSVQLAVLKRALKVRKPASMDACQSSRFSSCTSNGSRGATRPSTPCSEGWLHARVCMYVCCVSVCVCCASVCVFRFSSCTSNGSRGATGPSTPCSEGWLHARVYTCVLCECLCVQVL